MLGRLRLLLVRGIVLDDSAGASGGRPRTLELGDDMVPGELKKGGYTERRNGPRLDCVPQVKDPVVEVGRTESC